MLRGPQLYEKCCMRFQIFEILEDFKISETFIVSGIVKLHDVWYSEMCGRLDFHCYNICKSCRIFVCYVISTCVLYWGIVIVGITIQHCGQSTHDASNMEVYRKYTELCNSFERFQILTRFQRGFTRFQATPRCVRTSFFFGGGGGGGFDFNLNKNCGEFWARSHNSSESYPGGSALWNPVQDFKS